MQRSTDTEASSDPKKLRINLDGGFAVDTSGGVVSVCGSWGTGSWKSSSGTSGGASAVVVSSSGSDTAVGLLVVGNLIIVVADMKTEDGWVNVAVTEEEESTEDWLGKSIKNTVEDGLAVWGDDVASLGHTPCNWVDEPEEHGPDTAEDEGLADLWRDALSVEAGNPDDVPANSEESNHGEDEVSPLVGRSDESTNETGDNHDLIEENGVEDSWPWKTGGEK